MKRFLKFLNAAHFSSNGTRLPFRLTDDSDSDTDIQYRDDELSKHQGIGYSTNPAIASRIMPYPLCSEDDEDVPFSMFCILKIEVSVD